MRSYLDIEGIPFQLRYMVRRIRSRLPNALIVAGFWGTDDPVIDDDQQRKSGGVDHYVRSLREAVITCLEIAKNTRIASVASSSMINERVEI